MIRLWSADAPLTWPSSKRSSPRTPVAERPAQPVRGRRADRTEADDDSVPVAAVSSVTAPMLRPLTRGRRAQRDVGTGIDRRHRGRMRARRTCSLPEGPRGAIDEFADPAWPHAHCAAEVASTARIRRIGGDVAGSERRPAARRSRPTCSVPTDAWVGRRGSNAPARPSARSTHRPRDLTPVGIPDSHRS